MLFPTRDRLLSFTEGYPYILLLKKLKWRSQRRETQKNPFAPKLVDLWNFLYARYIHKFLFVRGKMVLEHLETMSWILLNTHLFLIHFFDDMQ